MKIFSFGSEFFGGQIDRIRSGFAELGHTNLSKGSEEFPDLIYSNDPANYDNALGCYNYFNRNGHKPKLIFCVLDIPPHCLPTSYDISRYTYIHNINRDFNLDRLKEQLLKADIVTTICKEVTYQLDYYCNIKAHTIYNPIKNINYLNLNDGQKLKNSKGQNYKYLYVGRALDKNKQFKLIYDLMKYRNEPPELLLVIGSENPGWGEWIGVVDEATLNLAYNSVEFFLFPSVFSSIGLPVLESCVAHTLPICCDDDPCLDEFIYPITLPRNIKQISAAINDINWVNQSKSWVISKSDEFKQRFSGKQIAQNILDLIK